MKIAVPTRNGKIDDHFGQCENYTLVSVSNDKKIETTENYQVQPGCGCKSGLANELSKKGVDIMLAGNMGKNAVQKITSAGIQVFRGCSGNVVEVVKAFLRNEISDSGESCHQHQRHQEHGQNCQH